MYVTVLFILCLYCSESDSRHASQGNTPSSALQITERPRDFQYRHAALHRQVPKRECSRSAPSLPPSGTRSLLREFLRVTVHSARSLSWLGAAVLRGHADQNTKWENVGAARCQNIPQALVPGQGVKTKTTKKKNNEKSKRLSGSGCLQQNLL